MSSSEAPAVSKPLRFCIVGTSVITENFINAGQQVDGFEFAAIFSRTEEKAREFAAKFPDFSGKIFTDLTAMAGSLDIDAVYIASPTSEHAKHSMLCLSNGKHVLCEKPVCSNSHELEAVLECAKKNRVAFMEAMRTLRSPNFALLKQRVDSLGQVRHFAGTACQYSSKWPAFLRGERPNVFLPQLSNGALMDIGCYPVHAAVAILGPPKSVSYHAVMLETGVDGGGTVVLNYGDKVATLIISKMSQGYTRTEVQTEQGTVSVDSTLEFTDVREHSTSSGDRLLSAPVDGADLGTRGSNRWAAQMTYEVRAFVDLVRAGGLEDSVISWSQSRAVMKVLDDARHSAGIHFPADEQSFSAEDAAAPRKRSHDDARS